MSAASGRTDGIHLFSSELLIFNRFGAGTSYAILACLHSAEVFKLRYL